MARIFERDPRSSVACILLATAVMPRRRPIAVVAVIAFTVVVVVAFAARASAQSAAPLQPHVRPEPAIRELVADAIRQSPTIRDLADRLEHSDVIVYVRVRPFTDFALVGRVAWLSRTNVTRLLLVEIACGQTWLQQVATLGHELRHAVEIADAPSIVDRPSLAAHYERIGSHVDHPSAGLVRYETDEAQRAGLRVRRELVTGRRTADGS